MCVSLRSKTGLSWSETLWLKNEHNYFKNTYYHVMDNKQNSCHENCQLGKAHGGGNNTLCSWNLLENDSKDLMSSFAIKWSLLKPICLSQILRLAWLSPLPIIFHLHNREVIWAAFLLRGIHYIRNSTPVWAVLEDLRAYLGGWAITDFCFTLLRFLGS